MAFKVAGPGGVLVDKSSVPSRVYINDGMNSRVLGFSSLGVCQNNPSQNCTTNSDCSGSSCQIQVSGETGIKKADIVLGQPNFNTSSCNGDSTSLIKPPATASSMCSMKPSEHSPFEGGSFAAMGSDSQGNLYVPDFYNNRVLKYNSPLTTDNIADDVWGQDGFSGNSCNKGKSSPDAATLCFDKNWTVAGVDIDKDGNLWVADNGNHRVLRFPNTGGTISKTADLVLGQANFASTAATRLCTDKWNAASCSNLNSGLSGLHNPVGVRVDTDGKVYVVDSWNHRIVVYDPPITSGMTGRLFASTGLKLPSGLQFDKINGGIWVNNTSDSVNRVVLLNFVDGSIKKIIGAIGGVFSVQDNRASVGVTSDGDVLVASSEDIQDVWVYKAPIDASINPVDFKLFNPPDGHNFLSNKGFTSARGIAITSDQLIVADAQRLVFWNIPNGIADLSNQKPYDGVAGVPNFKTFVDPGYGRIAKDNKGNFWALRKDRLEHYTLPLTSGELPDKTINSRDFRFLGQTQSIGLDLDMAGISVDPLGKNLWVAAPYHSRVFRLKIPVSLNDPFVIDALIGGEGFRNPPLTWEDEPICNTLDPNLLCYPGNVNLDNNGHIFVSDMYLEFHGTKKLYRFDKSIFPQDNTSLIVKFNDSALQKFDNIGAWELAFDSINRMVAGLSFYGGLDYNGPNSHRSPFFVNDILSKSGSNLLPDGGLNDIYAQAYALEFDSFSNLYVADLNWGRVLVYKNPFNNPVPTPTPSPVASPTPTPTPTSTPIPTSPPIVDSVVISNITSTTTVNSATVKWTTNVPSTSRVSYGTTKSLGQTTSEDINLVTSHSVTISGLTKQTRYFFKVHSKNSSGLESSSSIQQFRTKNK